MPPSRVLNSKTFLRAGEAIVHRFLQFPSLLFQRFLRWSDVFGAQGKLCQQFSATAATSTATALSVMPLHVVI